MIFVGRSNPADVVYPCCLSVRMIYHLVLLKVKPTASSEELLNLSTALESLISIKGVLTVKIEPANKSVYAGYDDRTKGYTHALLVILSDKKALEVYDKDPTHLLVKSSVIKPLLDTTVTDPVLAVDWEGAAPDLPKGFFCKNATYFAAAAAVLSLAGIVALRSRL